MRNRAERHLVALVVAVSLTLTGVTVWAVARQGHALRALELATLRNRVQPTIAARQAALLSNLDRLREAAAQAWRAGGQNELSNWSTTVRGWSLVLVRAQPDDWAVLPPTPLEQELPQGVEPESRPARTDLLTMLREFQQRAASTDPLTRAGALFAIAATEQRLGHPLAAARIFADAAQLVRATPGLAQLAFRAEIARVEALLTAGDHERARDVFAVLLRALLAEHPAGLGPREIAVLEGQAAVLGLAPGDSAATALVEVRARAQQREALVQTAKRVLATPPGTTADDVAPMFLAARTRAGSWTTFAVSFVAEGVQVVFVAPSASLLAQYWPPSTEPVPWEVRMPEDGDRTAPEPLARLGPAFGHAVVEATEKARAELQSSARRQFGILIGTAAGTTAAWGLVLWMMLRAVARQRELARLQGRFVADVSHELKTPLALVRLLAETLANQRVRDPQRVQSYLETITREAERLSVLLDNILDLGRIESGRKVYEFGPCDIAAVARQVWNLFEPQFREDGFEARLELQAGLPRIRADAQALQQVLVNLLQNAYRYGAQGRYVRLAITREGYVVLITVEDHGIGMTRQQLDRLGESFFRADDTRVRQTRGTGLGLAIVNHIITAHRGKLEVESRPNEGSRFTVWIPFEPLEAELAAPDARQGDAATPPVAGR